MSISDGTATNGEIFSVVKNDLRRRYLLDDLPVAIQYETGEIGKPLRDHGDVNGHRLPGVRKFPCPYDVKAFEVDMRNDGS